MDQYQIVMRSQESINRFNQLIGKYLRKETNAEESAFIEKYYASFEDGEEYTSALSPEEQEKVQQRMLMNIRRGVEQEENVPAIGGRPGWVLRIASAAAILLLIAGGAFLWFGKKEQKHESAARSAPSPQEIIPGGNKAMLTLNDGSVVYLDSSANGTISQQGGAQVVKLANGKIIYKVADNGSQAIFMNTMTTPRGGQYQLTLPDGTKVWLNAASSISYPTVFTGKERRVKMSGEVYFEVAKNAQRPFFVTVNDRTEIKVLGTHFNVNAYADEGATNATLLEGLVSVSSNNQAQMLQPGQQAQISSGILIKNNIDLDEVMAWKYGFFSFNKTDLQTVMKQLSRWYDVEVAYEGKMPDMKFWGGISRNSNLSQVIRILEESKVRFRVENKKIIVLSKK